MDQSNESKNQNQKTQSHKSVSIKPASLTTEESSEVDNRQPSLNRISQRAQIARQFKEGQMEWQEKFDALDLKKNKSICAEKSWEEILKIDESELENTEEISNLIELKDGYRLLQEERNHWWPEDKIVETLNKTHAIIRTNGTYILTETENADGHKDFILESVQSFELYHKNTQILCSDGKVRTHSQAWLIHPNQRKLRGFIFDPHKNKEGFYNLWRGFAVTPQKGDCCLYWRHVRENICNGSENLYMWLRKWLAYVFQRPQELHVGIVLQGSQGVGKGSFIDPLGFLFGQHYAPLMSMDELTSKFNGHLKFAILINANEALWGGYKSKIGIIKGMVTDPYIYIEQKGKDAIKVPNLRHLIVSSNEAHPVHLDADDRRFQVFLVAEHQKNNRPYFLAIRTQLEQGGYQALLHDLLNEDLTDFDPTKFPDSSASFEIKMLSADSTHRYIFEALNYGGFSIMPFEDAKNKQKTRDEPIWQPEIPKEHVQKDYTKWCQEKNETPLAENQLGRALRRLIPSIGVKRASIKGLGRVYCYVLPSEQQCKEEFCKAYNVDISIFD